MSSPGLVAPARGAFHADHDVTEAGVELLDEFEGYPSTRSLVDQGYAVLTF